MAEPMNEGMPHMTEQFPAPPNRDRQGTEKPIELKHEALRAIATPGPTYEEIAKFLVPPVSRRKVFRIAQYALDELSANQAETIEDLRRSQLLALDRMWHALEPRCGDPRVALTALRIINRKAKLLGLYDEAPRSQDVPEQPKEPPPDFSRLSLDEKLELECLLKKMRGDDQPLDATK